MNGYKIIRALAGVFAKIFYRVKYHGRENEPMEGGYIVIANHSSFYDPLGVACALKRPVCFMAKSDLMRFKIMAWLLKTCNVVPVNRGASDMAALRKVCEIVNNGDVTGIYPQGTRIRCSRPDPDSAQAGIGLVALRSKAPILPVAICYGKKRMKVSMFHKVHVYIGKPISYEEYMGICDGAKPTSHEIAKYAFGKVCDLFAENNHG